MFQSLTGSLSSIISMVPLPGKMTIIPLKQTSPIPLPSGLPYVVQFNPETYDEKVNTIFNQQQPIGATGQHHHYNRTQPRTFTFEFLIDGTGASGDDKKEVILEVASFKNTVEFKGDLHRPSYLLLVWGTYVVTAVLKDLNIKYTLFRSNGTPLRAIMTATFYEHQERVLQVLLQGLLSPDLSSRKTVTEGNKLPLMCHDVYETSRHYLEVAKANNITNFRSLKTGIELDFPPIDKS